MIEAIVVIAVLLAAAYYWRAPIIAWFKKQDTTT